MHDELDALMNEGEWDRLIAPYRIETRY
jgi:hypothetical protein